MKYSNQYSFSFGDSVIKTSSFPESDIAAGFADRMFKVSTKKAICCDDPDIRYNECLKNVCS